MNSLILPLAFVFLLQVAYIVGVCATNRGKGYFSIVTLIGFMFPLLSPTISSQLVVIIIKCKIFLKGGGVVVVLIVVLCKIFP